MENFENQTPVTKSAPLYKWFPFFNSSQAAFLIFSLAILFYSPSFNNEYALDDGIVIHQNSYVLEGVGGIGDILTEDTYASFYARMNATDQLSGGRYRPLPSITYAIEQEIIGPYRSGLYMQVTDLNHNGRLDPDRISYVGHAGKIETNYEYNDFVDQNNDGLAQASECFNCWDLNKNFKNDLEEDLNQDGIFNEIDCQVYGAKLRHFVNILLYALCCLLIFQLLSKFLFKERQDLAFLSALLFTIHPVHSEVVANIRGRDDLLSMIFIVLTLIQTFRYMDEEKVKSLFLAGLFAFLALMSKEYALLLLILIPVSLYFFRPAQFSSRKAALPVLSFYVALFIMAFIDYRKLYFVPNQLLNFFIVAIFMTALLVWIFNKEIFNNKSSRVIFAIGYASLIYAAFRLSAVNLGIMREDTEILNNPFFLATAEEAFATKIFVLLKGLGLQLWPNTLICDYSYKTIDYRVLSSTDFILSAILHILLTLSALVLTYRRHLLGFILITYLLFMVVISNLFFPTQIMFLESHLFHASLAICLLLGFLITESLGKINLKDTRALRSGLLLLCMVLVLLSCVKSWERSKDWKNDVTLFLKDVKNAPNSVLVLGNAGARWIDLADTREITGEALPGQEDLPLNDYNGTLVITAEELQASGLSTKREVALKKGISYLDRAVELHPKYVNGFLNLGLAWYKLGDDKKTLINWKKAEALYPNNPYLANYYQVYSGNLKDRGSKAFLQGNFKKALIEYNKWSLVEPNDPEAWYNKGGAYFNLGQKNAARQCFEKAHDLAPFESRYEETLNTLGFKPHPLNPSAVYKKGKNGC